MRTEDYTVKMTKIGKSALKRHSSRKTPAPPGVVRTEFGRNARHGGPDSRELFVCQASSEEIGTALTDTLAKDIGGGNGDMAEGEIAIVSAHATAANPFLQAKSVTVYENAAFLTFTITRGEPLDLVQTVEFTTKDSTAQAGVHYRAKSGTLSFSPGQNSSKVEIELINNSIADGQKEFYLELRNPSPCIDIFPAGPYCDSGAQGRFSGCADFQRGVIHDDEFPSTRVDPSFVLDHAVPGPRC